LKSCTNKLPITVGILVYKGIETVKNTFQTYIKYSLFECVEYSIVYIQKSEHQDQIYEYINSLNIKNLRITCSENNSWIGGGFRNIVNKTLSPYILLLEEDFVLLDYPSFESGVNLLKEGVVDCVRYRSCNQPGEPLYSWHIKGNELIEKNLTHLAECVHWKETPDKDFPELCQKNGDIFIFKSKNANFTNNPCLYRTDFYKDKILPNFCIDGTDVETACFIWWKEQEFNVGAANGFFSHYRIDGK